MPTMRGLKGRKKMFDKSKLTEQEREFVYRHERLHEEFRKELARKTAMDKLVDLMMAGKEQTNA